MLYLGSFLWRGGTGAALLISSFVLRRADQTCRNGKFVGLEVAGGDLAAAGMFRDSKQEHVPARHEAGQTFLKARAGLHFHLGLSWRKLKRGSGGLSVGQTVLQRLLILWGRPQSSGSLR